MFGLIKKIFIVLLSNMTQPILINLHPNEYSQEFHYYPFAVKLDRCVESWNTLNGLSNKVCVPNKTEDLNLNVFNMIKGINESKTLPKHISCKCKCKFDGRKCNSDQWWNNDKYQYEYKKRHVCEKDYIWNPSTCSSENGEYLASIMDDLAITCDEVRESYDKDTKTIPKKFNEKKAILKTQNFYILLGILLITTELLIAVRIYCYLIKYRAKQKNLLPFHDKNNELRRVIISMI